LPDDLDDTALEARVFARPTDAICDRVIHHAHRLTLKGPTMRDPGTRRGSKAKMMSPLVQLALRGGYCGSARHAIVVCGASWAVVDQRKSLWTVPELWKTHNTRFPQARWTAHRTRRPQRSTGRCVYGQRTNA